MNYLAHLYLSGRPSLVMVGNFMGDGVKGSNFDSFDPDIARGIRLHRLIDSYTDEHPVTAETRQRLRPHFRKFAGVVADVFYDHFLAKNWQTFHPEPLPDFANVVYDYIGQHHHHLPLKSQHFFGYMTSNNILESYAEVSGIHRVMQGMSRRTSFESNMEKAVHQLEEHYLAFEKEFEAFFPDLIDVVEKEGAVTLVRSTQ